MSKSIKKTICFDSFKKLYAFGENLAIDLSLSENPLGCSPRIRQKLSVLNTNINDYPDPNLTKLKKAISRKFRVGVNAVFISNGSESIIKLLPIILLGKKDDEAIIPEITFPMFEIVSRFGGNGIVFSKMISFDIDLENIKKLITGKTKLIFLCNPNNPTGRTLAKKRILEFVASVKPVVVVDEANIEFGGRSVIKEVDELENLVVLRTFSKGFGLAGLRVGFAVANPRIIQMLEKANQPFPISVVSEKAAMIALSDNSFIKKSKQFMNNERRFLTRELRKRGMKVIDSNANNILVDMSMLNKNNDLISRLNDLEVSVVKGSSFRRLDDSFIRISPRLRKTNNEFLSKIDEIINDIKT
jgi:histidinol-phosphate aminotransferase